MSTEQIRVRTGSGVVAGETVGGVHVFRGIPYAAPPFGERRFRPPVAPEAWVGVRDATRTGDAAPQPVGPPGDPWAPMYRPVRMGEDCLNLDIWTPDAGAAGLPVVVHLHGGGFVTGSGHAPVHSGRSFARDGIVHVSINYRLGIEGFLHLGPGRDNLGLRDQTAALVWVRENIARFGGDARRVTILGQSAGGVSVMTHLTMPPSAHLFRAAIAQSGSPIASMDADDALRQTALVARRLGVPSTAEAFRDVSVQRTTKAAQWLATRFVLGLLRGDAESLMITPFRAVHHTETLPDSPMRQASTSTVPLLAGTVTHETAGFVTGLTANPLLRPLARRGLRKALRAVRAFPPTALRASRADDPDEVIEAAWTDWAFRSPTESYLTRRPGPSWSYEFGWAAASERMGAVHGIDLPFAGDTMEVLEHLGPDASRYFAQAPRGLVAEMHHAVVSFISTSDPGWEARTPEVPMRMVFGEPSRAIVG